MFSIIPELQQQSVHNPRVQLDAEIKSHSYTSTVQAIWYNNRLHGGTRNETRITGWGGQVSPLLDPDYTGTTTIFAFSGRPGERWCHVWVCKTEDENDLAEERFGAVEPGRGLIFPPLSEQPSVGRCAMDAADIPRAWHDEFPSPNDILEKSLSLRPDFLNLDPDHRLLKRRRCEYELFLSIETAVWLPRIKYGFTSLSSFVGVAQTILQGRRSRSGISLEHHLFRIFAEEKLIENTHFDAQVETEPGHRPDFVFPSETAYHDSSFDQSNLRMLAVKTTVRERWRQVLDEASRIPNKHLLTLQEGVSTAQFDQMRESGIKLVVPQPLHNRYPSLIRPELKTLKSFIEEVKALPA